MAIIMVQNFTPATPAQPQCHVHHFVVIASLKFWLELIYHRIWIAMEKLYVKWASEHRQAGMIFTKCDQGWNAVFNFCQISSIRNLDLICDELSQDLS